MNERSDCDQEQALRSESPEQRGPAEGNGGGSTTVGTQRPAAVSSGLDAVRRAARRDRSQRMTALLHHVDIDSLEASYWQLNRQAAPGVDGQTWQTYNQDLRARLADLHARVHEGRYRASPVRRSWIAKADGGNRPLGVATIEDKIVQQAVRQVLEAVYEPEFKGFSYGFRPGRGQHDALDALWVGLTETPVHWVLDVDIRGYFDHIQHDWLMRFIDHRIGDKRIRRLIRKWLTVGAIADGQWIASDQGSPQGAVISPLLANIYLHYVFDLWVEQWRRKQARGNVIVVRYADDIVTGFQYREDAERFHRALVERLERFALELHPDKTRLIEFGPYAKRNRRRRGQGKPETFEFLGFTHIASQTRRGRYTVRRKTIARRFRATLKAIRFELKRRRHWTVPAMGRWLRRVLKGYYNYHGVPYNHATLAKLYYEVTRMWRDVLRRRSQKGRRGMTWERFKPIARYWLPRPRLTHPWPNQRLRRYDPRQEPCAVTPHARFCAGGAS